MIKYYTRACNFKYGSTAKELIKKKRALPLCGDKSISFNEIEIITRNKDKIYSKIINYKNISSLSSPQRNKVIKDLKNITSKRKNFLKHINFIEPSIMGIINLTPDSFSDGGKFNKKKKAEKHILEMIQGGARIIDVGGESTRPGSQEVSIEQELKRVLPVISGLRSMSSTIPISIDTRNHEVARQALDAGATIINDVSGLRSQEMIDLVLDRKVPVCIMHMLGKPKTMQQNPSYRNVVNEVSTELLSTAQQLIDAGHNPNKICLDPGIGFGKTLEHNLLILKNLNIIRKLGHPVAIGTSRKSFIGEILDLPIEDRIEGTAATVAIAIAKNVDLIRVHDVKEMIRVAKMSDAIIRGWDFK